MIDYDVLCQAISDWKAGRAPTHVTHDAAPPSPPAPPVREADELHDMDDDLEAEFEGLEEVVEQEVAQDPPQEQTIIYQLPIEPLDEDDL